MGVDARRAADPQGIASPTTNITTAKLLRLAGLSAMLAGLCYVLVGIFHPPNVPSSVTGTRWQVVHFLACAMCFFAVLGMVGLYARQATKTGWLGLVGFVMLTLWFVLIMGFTFVEAFILPKIATTDPKFVTAWMGMLVGPASKMDLGVMPTLWTLTAPIYIVGGLAFGIATFRAGILPRWGGRTARGRDRVGPRSSAASQRVSAENRDTGGRSPCLAGLCTLVRTATASLITRTPEERRGACEHHRYDCHNSVSTEKNLAHGGHPLSTHLCLDPDRRHLRTREGRSLRHRLWTGHRRHVRRGSGDHRGPRGNRHRRRSVPGTQETERNARAWPRRLAGSGSGHHLPRRRVPPDGRDLAEGRGWTGCATSRAARLSSFTTASSSSDKASCPPSTTSCWEPCCTSHDWYRDPFPASESLEAPYSSLAGSP